jgi:hypothetical protein
LLRIFLLWDMFFNPEILNRISNTLNLGEFIAQLLTPEDHQKMMNFKQVFFPPLEFIPRHIVSAGKVVVGVAKQNDLQQAIAHFEHQ